MNEHLSVPAQSRNFCDFKEFSHELNTAAAQKTNLRNRLLLETTNTVHFISSPSVYRFQEWATVGGSDDNFVTFFFELMYC